MHPHSKNPGVWLCFAKQDNTSVVEILFQLDTNALFFIIEYFAKGTSYCSVCAEQILKTSKKEQTICLLVEIMQTTIISQKYGSIYFILLVLLMV